MSKTKKPTFRIPGYTIDLHELSKPVSGVGNKNIVIQSDGIMRANRTLNKYIGKRLVILGVALDDGKITMKSVMGFAPVGYSKAEAQLILDCFQNKEAILAHLQKQMK